LVESAAHARLDDVPALVMALAPTLEANALVIFVVDYTQSQLIPLDGAGVPRRRPLAIDGTLAGRTFASERTHRRAGRPGRVWVPLVHGSDRLGVLEITTPGPPPTGARDAYHEVAAAVTQLLITRDPFGDKIERARRREPMQLAAEIMWSMLPPLTFGTKEVLVTGILEPCYDIGGDVFDYALNGDMLSVGLFDAVGHGTQASLLGTLTVSAYRNARRTGLSLYDTARSIDKYLTAHHTQFASAVLAELNCATGQLQVITAGHPAPLLLRNGRMIRALPAPNALPLGLGHMSDRLPEVIEETLHPGDQLLLYTDGVIEARAEDGEMFGVERLVDFVTRALTSKLPAPETMRRLVHAILNYQHDRLQDDATALIVQWLPPRERYQPPDELPGEDG
jgi:hypothetical protein